jgi:hypothetical protein
MRAPALPRSRAAARAERNATSRAGSPAIRSISLNAVESDATGPEQRLLITDRAQVRQAVAAVGEHHREIADHPTRIMSLAALASARPCQQPRPATQRCMTDQALSVRRDIYREIAPIALHLQGEPPEWMLQASNTRRIAAQADSSAAPSDGAATASCTIRAHAGAFIFRARHVESHGWSSVTALAGSCVWRSRHPR